MVCSVSVYYFAEKSTLFLVVEQALCLHICYISIWIYSHRNRQARQCTYNVTMRCIRATIDVVEKQ